LHASHFFESFTESELEGPRVADTSASLGRRTRIRVFGPSSVGPVSHLNCDPSTRPGPRQHRAADEDVLMKRRKPFTQADVSRALKGAQCAGLKVERFEVDPVTGKIIVISGANTSTEPTTKFDEWRAKRHARQT
jgi:hypothetical protein